MEILVRNISIPWRICQFVEITIVAGHCQLQKSNLIEGSQVSIKDALKSFKSLIFWSMSFWVERAGNLQLTKHFAQCSLQWCAPSHRTTQSVQIRPLLSDSGLQEGRKFVPVATHLLCTLQTNFLFELKVYAPFWHFHPHWTGVYPVLKPVFILYCSLTLDGFLPIEATGKKEFKANWRL